MNKQFHVNINDKDTIIIDIMDDERVSINIDQPPTKFIKQNEENRHPTIQITGLRWRNEERFHLVWLNSTLNTNDKVTIQIKDSSKKLTFLVMDENYTRPELTCSFCNKKSSEVKHLVKSDFYHCICDECVRTAQKVIDDKFRT